MICMAHGPAGAEIAVDRGPTLTCNHEAPIVTYEEPYTLAVRGRGDGSSFEFRQDGTANTLLTPNGGRAGIGVGAIAYAIQAGALRENPDSGPDGIGVQAEHAYTLEARSEVQAVAFSCKDYGGDAGPISPTLRSMGHNGSHANAGGQVAIATTWQVRRLTPRECERLQGFRDGHTAVPVGKKAAADGPRYKALGNSMAVPVIRWIGRRIDLATVFGE